MNFSSNLQKLRKKRNISQEQLAEKLGVTRQSVSKWESSASYPEMDKLISICQIFHVDLDCLVNGDVEEVEDMTTRGTLYGIMKSLADGIKKTIDYCEGMTLKEVIRFVAQIFLIILVILICQIPFRILEEGLNQIFYHMGHNVGVVLGGFISCLIYIAYAVFACFLFLYIYKVKFLDKMDKGEDIPKKEVESNSLKEKKPVIKNSWDHLTFLEFISLGILYFFKFILLVFLVPIVFCTIGVIIAFVLGIILIFEGLFLPGPLLCLLALFIFGIVLMEMIFNFIVNHKSNFKRIFIEIIISFVIGGIGVGLSLWYFTNIEVYDYLPSSYQKITKEETIDMTDGLIIHDTYNQNITYIEDNTMTNQVKFKYSYYDGNQISIQKDNGIYFHNERPIVSVKKYKEEFIKNLQKNKIYNYDHLYDVDVIVTTSKENILKLKENKEKVNSVDRDYFDEEEDLIESY